MRRGFTLIELGIVMGVIGVLMAALVSTTAGFLGVAKDQRTGRELQGLSRASSAAMRGNMRFVNGVVQFNADGWRAGANWVPVFVNAPRCYDLTVFNGRKQPCPPLGRDGANWNGTTLYPG